MEAAQLLGSYFLMMQFLSLIVTQAAHTNGGLSQRRFGVTYLLGITS
jgi:hypothetical protein